VVEVLTNYMRPDDDYGRHRPGRDEIVYMTAILLPLLWTNGPGPAKKTTLTDALLIANCRALVRRALFGVLSTALVVVTAFHGGHRGHAL